VTAARKLLGDRGSDSRGGACHQSCRGLRWLGEAHVLSVVQGTAHRAVRKW
jgi:hypothetical protein